MDLKSRSLASTDYLTVLEAIAEFMRTIEMGVLDTRHKMELIQNDRTGWMLTNVNLDLDDAVCWSGKTIADLAWDIRENPEGHDYSPE